MKIASLSLLSSVSILTSCVSYRYFPPHQQFYNFDSARDYRIAADIDYGPLKLSSLTGLNLAAAYSAVNHFALTGKAYAITTLGQHQKEIVGINLNPYYDLSSHSYALGCGFGLGFYTRIDSANKIDFFADYDYQRIDYDFLIEESGSRYRFQNPLHTITFQPSYYRKLKNVDVSVGCGISGVYTKPFHYYNGAPRTGDYATDIYLQPGFAVHAGIGVIGFYLNHSFYHGFNTTTFGYPSKYQVPYNLYLRFLFNNNSVRELLRKAPNKR
jgi:hypothetical protein